MNQGSQTGKGTAFMVDRRSEELCPGGDRASVVAKKRGNARGVKGGRKVEMLNERMKENSTLLCPYPYVRLRVRTNRRVKVLSGREHWPVRS